MSARTINVDKAPYRVTWRDRLAEKVANWALMHVATFEYQQYIWVLIRKGRESLHAELGIEDES